MPRNLRLLEQHLHMSTVCPTHRLSHDGAEGARYNLAKLRHCVETTSSPKPEVIATWKAGRA